MDVRARARQAAPLAGVDVPGEGGQARGERRNGCFRRGMMLCAGFGAVVYIKGEKKSKGAWGQTKAVVLACVRCACERWNSMARGGGGRHPIRPPKET